MKKKNNIIIGLAIPVIFVLLAVVATACSSSRKAVSESSTGRTAVAPRAFAISSQLAETYKDWDDLYVPFSVELYHPISFGLSGRATMVRNKSIHLSMRILGLEMAVAYINQDSVWVVDKFHKYVCATSTSALLKKANFTVGDIQDMMLGRAFYPGTGTLKPSHETDRLFSVNERGDSTLLLPRKIPAGASWHYVLTPGPKLSVIDIALSSGPWLKFNFANIITTVAGSTASQLEVVGAADKLSMKASVEWNLKKAKWNEGRQDDWTPPTGYQRVSLASLIKALKQ